MLGPVVAAALVASAAAAYPAVHVSSSASAVELFAATELRNYLGNMSSAEVALHVADEKPDGDVIAVGFDAATGLGLAASELDGLKNDSYVISSKKSGIPSGSFVVTGGKASARGTMFAAYDFLRLLGCKFLARGSGVPPEVAFTMQEELPASPPSTIPPVDVTYHPLYEYRDNNEWAAATLPSWAGKLGYNGPNAHGAAPGTMAVAYAGGFVHTSYGLLTSGGGGASSGRGPPKDLWDQHREWFWCAQQLSLLFPTF